MLNRLLLMLLLVSVPAFGESDKVWDGAFDLKFGMTFDEVESALGVGVLTVERHGDDVLSAYRWKVASTGEEGWHVIRVYIHPSEGLFNFLCVKDVKTNSYGTTLKYAYNKALDTLTETYGKGRKIDRLERGSLWDEPRYYMMGLLKGDRHMGSRWFFEDGEQHPLSKIALWMGAINRENGFVAISYSSKAREKIEKEAKKKDDDRF